MNDLLPRTLVLNTLCKMCNKKCGNIKCAQYYGLATVEVPMEEEPEEREPLFGQRKHFKER